MAAAVAFLLSPDAEFVNGTDLRVGGGVTSVFAPAPEADEDFVLRYPFATTDLQPRAAPRHVQISAT